MSLILLRRTLKSVIPKNGVQRISASAALSGNETQTKPFTGEDHEDDFRVLQIRPTQEARVKQRRTRNLSSILPPKMEPRASKMDPDNFDWMGIWSGPRTFHPHSVPLPVRQGYIGKNVPYEKYANPELMKIPNFLHLTPPAIKAHCEALKKFCTPFPKELESRETCERYFPITVVTYDYLHSSPSIRDPMARVVTLKIKLKNLPLDEHARDKLLRLVGEHYNPNNDELTIVTDRCPLRKQNYDYAQYLLTALFFESWKVEEWEAEKSEADMEKYIWENNASAKKLASIVRWSPDNMGKDETPLPEEELTAEHLHYKKAVTDVMHGETAESILRYKAATKRILFGNSKEQELS